MRAERMQLLPADPKGCIAGAVLGERLTLIANILKGAHLLRTVSLEYSAGRTHATATDQPTLSGAKPIPSRP